MRDTAPRGRLRRRDRSSLVRSIKIQFAGRRFRTAAALAFLVVTGISACA